MLNAEERKQVSNILTRPKECREKQRRDKREEKVSEKEKRVPVIDLFLNPARSEELKEIKKQSPRREKHTKVTSITISDHLFSQEELSRAFPNLFRLLWKSTLPCYPSNTSSPGSAHMLRECWWQGEQIDCSKIFTPVITDTGVCCAFNLRTGLKESIYRQLVEKIQVRPKITDLKFLEGECWSPCKWEGL